MLDDNRRTFLKLAGSAGAMGITGLAGCTGSGNGSKDTTTKNTGDSSGDSGGETTTNETTTQSPKEIGMVYALGGLGDKSFNDMANQGIKKAKKDFGIDFSNGQPSGPSDFSTYQRRFAQSKNPNYDLICCIGFAQASALKKTSKSFPNQDFMIVDSVIDADNVASYVFKEQEGSFQVGYLAGLLTTMDYSEGAGSTNGDKVVGFVGGKKVPLIEKFQAGYMAGVKHADSDIEVLSTYANSWSDPAKGKEIALSMYDKGADIVYHAAGGTGIGVFKAAQQRGRYAIGVDSDQSKSAPKYSDVILASMVKRTDSAVYRSVKNVDDGDYKGGSTVALGLEKNGVEAVIGQDFDGKIPDAVTKKLETSRQAIVDGKLDVPTKPANV